MQLLLTLIEQYGLWLVFVNVLVLQIGLPVPAYPTLIVVGAITARGEITAAQAIAVAVTASLIADLLWYVCGARQGRRVLRLMCRLSLSPDSCVRQTENIYERWEPPSLMFAKFVPGFAAVATSIWPVWCARASRVLCCSTPSAPRCGAVWPSRWAGCSAMRSTMCWRSSSRRAAGA
jgi:membrane protein DedA with SNARE-associated domain